MKKLLTGVSLVLVLALLLGVTAFAADVPTDPGIYGVALKPGYETLSYKVLTKEGTEVNATDATINDATEKYYQNGEKLSFTLDGLTEGSFQLVLGLSDGDVPTESNIEYIDQKTVSGGKVEFTVYPKDLTGTITVKVYGSDGTKEVLSFNYYQAYTLGDVDGLNAVDLNDAILIMRYLVGLEELDGTQQLAANVDGANGVDLNDAIIIMRYLVGLETI